MAIEPATRAPETPPVRRRVAVLAAAVALAAQAARPCIATSATTLLSPNLSGAAAGGAGLNRALGSSADMSPNGRYVLFTSTATNLVDGINDTNGVADVFVRDIQDGTTAILSVDADGNALGTVGNLAAYAFVFSPDSTRVLFRTQATNVVAGLADTNGTPDWFVRDLVTGATSCLTINAAGTSTGNSSSFTNQPPVFSPDGKLVAFTSLAGDLVAGITDSGGRDLFLRDFDAETTSLVSITTDGTASGSNTEDPPEFSPDGRYLAFLNSSAKLVAGVSNANNFTDLFVRDLQTHTTIQVTRTVDDKAAQFSSGYEWAPDGHAILFASAGTNLVAGVTDTNNLNDLFSWDTQSHAIGIVSVDPDGTAAGDAGSIAYGISPDSRYVAFQSASTNLTPESAGGDFRADLYVRDTETDTTTYVGRNETASVSFGLARFTGDGEHLLFESDATDEVPGLADTNDDTDLFLYDLHTGAKSGVTVNFAGTATGDNTGTVSDDDVVLSPDGRYVSFVSDATDLVPNFTRTETRDLFVRDLVAGVTSLVTVYINGGGAGYDQGGSRDAEFSRDSRFLVFTDKALLASPVTTPFNFNFADNLYAFDVVNGTQNLLTVSADGTGPADPYVSGQMETGVEPFSFFVDPAGGSVVFSSTFIDMVAGVTDTPFTFDLFLTDLPTATSPSQCGDPILDSSLTMDLSAGSRLVKASDALYILRTAVGSATCDLCVCDVDGSGAITATDALIALKIAVGQDIALACPACSSKKTAGPPLRRSSADESV